MIQDPLLAEIEAFVAETGLAETTLGGRAVKDSRFIARIRAGKAVTYQNVQRLKEFMREHRATPTPHPSEAA